MSVVKSYEDGTPLFKSCTKTEVAIKKYCDSLWETWSTWIY